MDPIASSHENEVHDPSTVNIQAPQPELMNPAVETECEDDEFWPLSGKPYFNVVLAKSHVKHRWTLVITTVPEMSSDFPSQSRLIVLLDNIVCSVWTSKHTTPFRCIVFEPPTVFFLPTKLHPVLPSATVPAVLRCCGKNWEIMFYGEGRTKRFCGSGWKEFIVDNDLKIGDALVVELADSSTENLKFRVQILRGDFPAELQVKVSGTSIDNAIEID